jgi:hypothetical protein
VAGSLCEHIHDNHIILLPYIFANSFETGTYIEHAKLAVHTCSSVTLTGIIIVVCVHIVYVCMYVCHVVALFSVTACFTGVARGGRCAKVRA